MKIELSEEEIKVAIVDYVGSQGISIDPTHTEVELRAGRGENGMTATISIEKPSEATEEVKTEKVTPIKKKEAKADPKDTQEEPDADADEKEPAANKPLFS